MDIKKFIGTHKNRIFPLIGAVIVFALCFFVLYGGENVGVSDNGDFRRVLLVNNLEYKDDTDYYYLFKEDYTMKTEGSGFFEKISSLWKENEEADIYSSPQFLIIKASKTLNFLANTVTGKAESDYDIVWLAFIYILMFSIAAWGIFKFFTDSRKLIQISVAVIFLLIFCDAGYILYFNSFYGEPLQYVSLMMLISVGLLIYKRPSVPKIICFFISLYFFAGSKLANIPYSVIICVLSLTFVFLKKSRLFRYGTLIAFAVAVISIINLYSSIPQWMNRDTTYQAVFFGILKESDTPEKDLKFLGVDEKYAVLMNTNAYMDADEYKADITTEQFEKDFYDRVSKADILMFYLLHPIRFVKSLDTAIANSAYIRPPNSGNSSITPMEFTNRYSLWSNIRSYSRFLYCTPVVFALFILITAYIAVIDVFYYKRRKSEPKKKIYMMASVNILILGLWINLVLPILGNGEADIAKHMFLFTTCVDILFSVIVISVINAKLRVKVFSSVVLAAVLFFCCYTPHYSTVEFGTYDQKPIEWEVYENLNDGTQILITKDSITDMPFDADSNLWETSDLRTWLNNDFLTGFTEEELNSIIITANSNILPSENKELAVAGDHTHYWNFTREGADDLEKTAYHYYVDDFVYIPTLEMLKNLSGYSEDYWLMCPYARNTVMERYVRSDGFVLHTSVQNSRGVRAVIRRRVS